MNRLKAAVWNARVLFRELRGRGYSGGDGGPLKRLARPEAATKVKDRAAARSQRSAFSGQLLNQDSEHAFDFHGLR